MALPSAEMIKMTQETLGKFVKKPPMSEKLLKKPPFRFLHDIITSVIRNNGVFVGLFSEEELLSENVKDRDTKIAFLNKVITVLSMATGKTLTVKSSKIIAGQEPEKTNELLICLGQALEQNIKTSEAVKKYKQTLLTNSEELPKPKTKETIQKTSEMLKNSKSVNEKLKKVNDKSPPKKDKRDISNSRDSKTSLRDSSLSRKDVTKENNEKLKNTKVKTKNKDELILKQKSQDSISKQKTNVSTDKSEINLSTTNIAEGINPENDNINTEIIDKHLYLANERKDISASIDTELINSSFDLQEIGNKEFDSQKSIKEENNDGKKIDGEFDTRKTEIEDHNPTDERTHSISKEKKERQTNNNLHDSLTESVANEGNTVERNEDSNSFLNPKTIKSPENMENKDIMERREQEPVKPGTPTVQPVGNFKRTPSARPSSVRPGAPRLRDRNDDVLSTNEPTPPGKVNIIVEKIEIDNEDDDGSLVYVEPESRKEIDNSTDAMITNASGDHGHLVQQILDSQKQFTQMKTGKTEIEWEFGVQRAREASSQEIEQLRFNLQALSRAANPLSKLLDHIQEDVEVMRQELLQWMKTYEDAKVQLAKEKSVTEQSLQPLILKIKQLNEEITEKHEKIYDLKSVIHKNSIRINKLLASGRI